MKARELLTDGSTWAARELARRFVAATGALAADVVRHQDRTYVLVTTDDAVCRAYTIMQVAHHLTIAIEEADPQNPCDPHPIPHPVGETDLGRALAHTVEVETPWTLDTAAGCAGVPVKVCPGCRCEYDTPTLHALPWVGVQYDIALRNCRCGSTIADPTWMPPEPERVGQ